MHIETTMRYHFTPGWMAEIKRTENTEYCGGNGKPDLLHILSWSVKCHSHFENKGMAIFYKVKHKSALWLTIPLLEIYPRKMKIYAHKKILVQEY